MGNSQLNRRRSGDLLPWAWVRRSFRAKLIFAMLAVVSLALTVVGATYYFRMSAEIEQNTYTSLDRLLDQFVITTEMHLDNVRREAWEYFSSVDVQTYVEHMQHRDLYTEVFYSSKLNQTLQRNPLFDSMAIYSSSGPEESTAGYYRAISDADRDTEAAAKKQVMDTAIANRGRGDWIITKKINRTEEGFAYTLSYVQALKRINTYNQKIIGVMRIDLNVDRLNDLFLNLKLDYSGDFSIVDSSGTLLMSENTRRMNTSLANEPLYRFFSSADSAFGHFTFDDDGKTWIGVYRRFEKENWAVIGKVPLHEVLANVNKVGFDTVSIGLVSLLIALVLAYTISVGVTRPLRKLRFSMSLFEQGNFNVQVPIKSHDEIGYLGLSFNRMTAEIKRLINRVYRTELLKQEMEIKALQAQMNPHFLYNALGTIDSLAVIQGDKRIAKISRALGSMLRYNINGSNIATLGTEIKQVEQYLFIQQMRYEDRLVYQIEVEKGLYEIPMPKLLLQPIVENAVIHGVERKREQVAVNIAIQSSGESFIWVMVEDNGSGMATERLEQLRKALSVSTGEQMGSVGTKKSLGLTNVNQRIQLYYGESCGLRIDSEPGRGTTVVLLLSRHVRGEETR